VNLELTDDQRMLRDGATRFFEKSYDFRRRLELARSGGGFSRATWKEFAELGWLAAAVPETHGGLDFGAIELAIIAEECGRHLVLEPFTACGVLPARLLASIADPVQQAARLPGLAAAEQIYAVALSEPGARGDVDAIEATAERTQDGRWRLSGHKSLVVGAPIADRLLIVVRSVGGSDGSPGLSLFDVSLQAPGMRVESYSLVDGTPAADVWLASVVVEADALLGRDGGATAGIQDAVDEAIILQCAETLGSLEDVLALCSEYLKSRKQFGVPIGSFQALQHRMADMAIETSQARAGLHRGLQALTVADAGRRSIDVSGIKAQVNRAARFVTQQGIQLHGGYGITEEYRVGHHWRRLLLADSVFGSPSHHLARYARRIQWECLPGAAPDDGPGSQLSARRLNLEK